jgi:hypothetical protein
MDMTDAAALTVLIKVQLSNLSTLITEDGYTLVCDQTSQELGWSFPVTNPTKLLWMLKRGTRHALNLLQIAAAYKFKYKQINLQQRFDHFKALIDVLDKEYKEAMASDIATFSGVEAYKMFGTKIDSGFSYDIIGNDQTYNYDKYVNFSPIEEE